MELFRKSRMHTLWDITQRGAESNFWFWGLRVTHSNTFTFTFLFSSTPCKDPLCPSGRKVRR